MSDVNDKTATAAGIAASVSARKVTALAVVDAALARIATLDKIYNAFTAVVTERARQKAAAIDAAVAAGKPVGPLAGVPFAVKNLIDIDGMGARDGWKNNARDPPGRRDP